MISSYFLSMFLCKIGFQVLKYEKLLPTVKRETAIYDMIKNNYDGQQ